ncbi:MAG: hypothetical protein LUI09_06455 [Prevotellaceae bacterium]|nr:hypothetical protein [Prevotellaceae bacterium]
MRTAVFAVIALLLCGEARCQEEVNQRIESYFSNYKRDSFYSTDPIRANTVDIDEESRTILIDANDGFRAQPFNSTVIGQIYSEIARLLPQPYNTFDIRVTVLGQPIEEFVEHRTWGGIEYAGNPWVMNANKPYKPEKGLGGTHISLWASHGKYYDIPTGTWKWQRPRLYCTNEDLFTQSIVIPFLIPMLEGAGAVVFSPRERDWQRNEAIVDNDTDGSPSYLETAGATDWQTAWGGFAKRKSVYYDKENPFEGGTYRYTSTTPAGLNKSNRGLSEAEPSDGQASSITWKPEIPQEGDYAVYVSYATLPTSVSDAQYTVVHQGVRTLFRVNQQMGGGTWVYLGTFHFDKGQDASNCVILSNQSNYRGIVTADAVRFGGGMGNIARGDSVHANIRSYLPRYLECSRYSAQWGGMPYSVYGSKESTSDYDEDINSRSRMTDYLAGGSVYLPCDSGLNVPIELSLALHSDAGYRSDNSIVGTLGIYTSGKYTGPEYEDLLAEGLYPSGISRMASRDLCESIMTSICSDMRKTLGRWTRRQLYDKNYSESRVPDVPGVIVEMLSHQNFADMRYGHDPWFKFLLARAIYKGALGFVSEMHGRTDYVVQPLPVSSFAAILDAEGDSATLSWQPRRDPLEVTAEPTYYILYTAQGRGDYDNGRRVFSSKVRLKVTEGELTRFKVSAVNEGGESLRSEELCVYLPKVRDKAALMVNAFRRLASPQPVDNGQALGFDINQDPGVVFQHCPCFCGKQIAFDPSNRRTLGDSGTEYEGLLVAGNTFDYPTLHAKDLLVYYQNIAISSCSSEAFADGSAETKGIDLIDYILGAQRDDGYSLTSSPSFSPEVRTRLADFTQRGGALLMSGAYISEELQQKGLQDFGRQVLHLSPQGVYFPREEGNTADGMGTHLSIYTDLCEASYCVKRCSVLAPQEGSFCTMLYSVTGESAAVACETDKGRTLVFGFPLETITDPETRRAIMIASIKYLIYTR